jgi:hypothetical protein
MAQPGVTQPETRYAQSGDVSIAFQVVGDGPLELVYVAGWVSHLEYLWQEPNCAAFLRRLASFSRLILLRQTWDWHVRPGPRERSLVGGRRISA